MDVKKVSARIFHINQPAVQLWISRAGMLLGCGSAIYGAAAANIPLLIAATAFLYAAFQYHLLQQSRIAARGLSVAAVMTPREKLDCLSVGTPLSAALNIAARSLQRSFPVFLGEELVGLVERDALLRGSVDENEHYLPGLMNRDFLRIELHTAVGELLEKTGINPKTPVAVMAENRLLGLIFPERLPESLLFQSVRSSRERSIPSQEHV